MKGGALAVAELRLVGGALESDPGDGAIGVGFLEYMGGASSGTILKRSVVY